MNLSWVTLRDLEYIVAVAEHQHFGKAAEACHVSQPALSAQIRKAEDLLGVTLFERSNRRVVVTPVGETIVGQARVVLEEANKIGNLAKTSKTPLSGPVRLGVIATLGPYLMPRILGPLRKKYPNLQLLLKEGLTDALLQDLRSGALDAVLAAETFKTDGLRVFPLFNERFLLAVSTAHPLAVKSPLHTRDLRSDDMILLEDGHCLRDQTIQTCPTHRRGNFRTFHATSLETLRHLVASSCSYSLIPQLAVNKDANLSPWITYREFETKNVGRKIILVCRERFSRMKDVEELAAFLHENLPQDLTPA